MNIKLETADARLSSIVPEEASPEMVAAGFVSTEGPVWCGDHLLFTETPRNRIVRWRMRKEGMEVTTFRYPCGHANGMTLDRGGRLIVCEAGMRRVSRTEVDGSYAVIADRYEGRRLNTPNDVVARSDGTVYFTDSAGGFRDNARRPAHAMGPRELPFQGVFSVTPDGKLVLLADDFPSPNGLAFSSDEKELYIINSRPPFLRAYDVAPDGTISNGRLFVNMETPDEKDWKPDGMKVDQQGHIYVGGPGGLWVLDPGGKLLGRILMAARPVNMAWGDKDWKSLYIASNSSVYRLRLEIPGVIVGAPAAD